MIPIIPSTAAKGGVGKSTLAVNLSYCFHLLGLKPLIIDLDPQGSATRFLANTHRNSDVNRLAALKTRADIEAELEHLKTFSVEARDSVVSLLTGNAVTPLEFHGVGLVGYAHGANDQIARLSNIEHQERFIEALNATIQSYQPDLVFIDTPPSNMDAGSFAIAIATHLLIPLEATEEGLRGAIIADHQRQVINRRNQREKHDAVVEIAGVVPMDVHRSILSRKMVECARIAFPSELTSAINHAATIGEACTEGLPVIAYEAKMKGIVKPYELYGHRYHKAGRQIMQVATEVGVRIGVLTETAPPIVDAAEATNPQDLTGASS